MSASIEWVAAIRNPHLITGDQEAPDGNCVEIEGEYGLVLANPDGAVITGSLRELRRLLINALVMVEQSIEPF